LDETKIIMKQILLLLWGFAISTPIFSQTGTSAGYFKISENTASLNLSNGANFGFVGETLDENRIFLGAPLDGNGKLFITEIDDAGSPGEFEIISSQDFDLFNSTEGARFGESAVEVEAGETYIIGAPGYDSGGSLFKVSQGNGGYEIEKLLKPEELGEVSDFGYFLALDDDYILVYSSENEGKIYRMQLQENQLVLVETIGINNPFLEEKLDPGDEFGSGLSVYDLNGDGNTDILCGAPGDDDQNEDYGAAYVLYRNGSKEITSIQKYSREEGDFGGFMNAQDDFGISVRGIGDLDENGYNDLAIGAPGDDDGGLDIGAVWILFMRPDGTVKNEKKINRLEGNFDGDINFQDNFGKRIATVGDLNGDGTIDIVSGSILDDDGGTDRGAAFTVFIERCPSPSGDFDYEVDGGTVQFFAEGGEGYSYIWNFDDGGYSQEQNPVHTYESNGTFWVCLAINNDCGGNNFCKNVAVSTLSVEDEIRDQTKVFPNPATNLVNIQSPVQIEEISLMDITGKMVYKALPNSMNTTIELDRFPAGVYIVKWVASGNTFVERIQLN